MHEGDLYLHVDVDVCDAAEIPDLLYPVAHGPAVSEVLEAVRRVAATGRVLALGIAATWRHARAHPPGGATVDLGTGEGRIPAAQLRRSVAR